MTKIVFSINDIPIRLTDERWRHISIGHPEMAGYLDEILDCIKNPEIVYQGNEDEFLALKSLEKEKQNFSLLFTKKQKMVMDLLLLHS